MSVDGSVVRVHEHDAVVSQRAGHATLAAAMDPLLASATAKSLESLRIDLLSFVRRDGEYATTKPPIFQALSELATLLEEAELPKLRKLVVGPLFSEAMPTKPAPPPLRLEKAPHLRPRTDGFLEIFSEAWLEIVDATDEALSFGHTKGQKLPLNVETKLELHGKLLMRGGKLSDESPAELRGRPWKVVDYPDMYALYASVYWGPGWKIQEVKCVNGEPIEALHIHIVPGDVVVSPQSELTLKLCAR